MDFLPPWNAKLMAPKSLLKLGKSWVFFFFFFFVFKMASIAKALRLNGDETWTCSKCLRNFDKKFNCQRHIHKKHTGFQSKSAKRVKKTLKKCWAQWIKWKWHKTQTSRRRVFGLFIEWRRRWELQRCYHRAGARGWR